MSILQRIATNQNYQFWTFQFTFWFFWASFYLIFQYFAGVILADALVALLLTWGLRYLYRAVWGKGLLVRTLAILLGSAITGLLWNIFKRHLEFTFFGEETVRMAEELGVIGYYTHQYLGLSFWVMLAWSGLYFGLTLYFLLQEERATSLSALALAHESQLRMLRYQLNPHFLFNTLNAISTLILDADNKTANSMVSKLSDFLRYSLDKDPLQKVSLDHEVSTLKLYLEIEKVRFEERLTVEFNIQERAGEALIPSMLLQPLIENSIKYAIADSVDGGKIRINAKMFAGDLLIEVQDDGPGINMENGELPAFRGVGIKNIRERLKVLYGATHSCRISEALPHGLKIEIRIPFEVETRISDTNQDAQH